MYSDSALTRLTPLFAVVTLPLGILAAMFAGPMTAAVVFVVGWLLLTPASAILFGPPSSGSMGADEEFEQLIQERMHEELRDGSDGHSQEDPVEELRRRYAEGEIDEVELERRLDALLETEDVDPDDETAIERAMNNIETGHAGGDTETRDTETATDSGRTEVELDRE
jgi:hypothetical protein